MRSWLFVCALYSLTALAEAGALDARSAAAKPENGLKKFSVAAIKLRQKSDRFRARLNRDYARKNARI